MVSVIRDSQDQTTITSSNPSRDMKADSEITAAGSIIPTAAAASDQEAVASVEEAVAVAASDPAAAEAEASEVADN